MAADTFYICKNGLFYDLHNARTGEVEVELIDCMGEALNYQAEYTTAALEAEAAEAEEIALSVEAAQAELPSHVIDFLHALDRGDFGAGHRFSDGSESAYVAALRTAVAPFERRV